MQKPKNKIPNKQQLCAQLKYIKRQKSGKQILSSWEDIKPMSLLATKFWEHIREVATLMQLANAMN